MRSISVKTAITRILTGRKFLVVFTKRSTGEIRAMQAQWGVKTHLRGGEAPYDFARKGLICVFDHEKQEYRTVPVEGLLRLQVEGQKEVRVKHAE